MPSAVALIPARAGSQRIPGKNTRPLAGHPLIAYSIAAARQSGLFGDVVVSTDSEEIAAIASHYGATIPGLRPADLADATSPDIEWVQHVLAVLADEGRRYDAFSILRPTSPFRGADTIHRAWDQFVELGERASSIRAVELCREHPGKMWTLDGSGLMTPLLDQPPGTTPFHSSQYAALPEVYIQTSSLEIAWHEAVEQHGTIAGDRVAPFFAEGPEALSLDHPDDWERAKDLVTSGRAELPAIEMNAPGAA